MSNHEPSGVHVAVTDGVRTIRVSGAITEATDFSAALAGGPPRAVVDLSAVDRVNSYGVREWIRFLKTLVQAGVDVTLDGVSVPMVRQMNMIPQVRAGARVAAIDAPYYCPACDDERAVRLDAATRSPPATPPCPTCGAAMDFDDVADGYFAFVADDDVRR
jgi:anti-anti-sigma regulatory factor